MGTTKFLNHDLSSEECLSSRSSYRVQSRANKDRFLVADLARTVLVNADETFYFCVVPASCRIDMEILSWMLGADEIHFATEEEIAELFHDCRLDPTPTLDKIFGLPSIMDKRTMTTTDINIQVLPHSKSIQINFIEFERMATPQVLDFCY